MENTILTFNDQYFNLKDTLECGQIFRFLPKDEGYLVFSMDKCAYCYNKDGNAYIECKKQDQSYFINFFDTERDYSKIVQSAIESEYEILSKSAILGKGIRILNQNPVETLFSFIISQNNNIPRIKNIIERLCTALGKKHVFMGIEYHAFPTVKEMASASLDFYKQIGLGYRAEYIKSLANSMDNGFDVISLGNLQTQALKGALQTILGVGPKVADCVSLFGFHRVDSFPVDTWIEKVYLQDFNGKLLDRNKISKWFVEKFGQNAGFFQQYLFYYKRSLAQ
ncbi:MAG: DNA-3-methyladenine glycosylase 2 family protein [Clostridia bacterium]|nr:DNA-3-methyladenine glycosylase 2 family protein [Clostridia bacterium]